MPESRTHFGARFDVRFFLLLLLALLGYIQIVSLVGVLALKRPVIHVASTGSASAALEMLTNVVVILNCAPK